MDTLAFIASLVHSLAWPVVLIVVVVFFRRPIAGLFPRIREAKLGKLSLKLQGADQLLKSAKLELEPPTAEIHPPPAIPISVPSTARKQIVASDPLEPLSVEAGAPEESEADRLENVAPGIRIDLDWQRLSRNLLAAARGTGLKGRVGLARAVQHLASNRLIPDAFPDAFERVKVTYRTIQKQNGEPVNAALAQDFAAACGRLNAHLAQIATEDTRA